MDEEFFFPQNVRQTYRLWLMGPTHLKRLIPGVLLGLIIAWALRGTGVLADALITTMFVVAYAAVGCLPLWGDDSTLWDVGMEIIRHKRSRNHFPTWKGVLSREIADLDQLRQGQAPDR